jgi:NDP-sugar pyrophosphorylase family protein
MQALILAAGMGTRLTPLTAHSTKCMVPFGNRRLIEHLLDALASAAVHRAIMVVGHGAAEVRMFLGDQYRDITLHYVENASYRTTNNIYSLALASHYLRDDDTLLVESDLILHPALIQQCVTHPAPAVAVVAPWEPWMDGTVTTLDTSSNVTRFIPKAAFDPAQAENYFKTVNLYKLSQAFSENCFLPLLAEHIANVGPQVYYEEVFGLIVAQGLATVTAQQTGNLPWYEIDTPEDLHAATERFANVEERTKPPIHRP